MAPQVPWYLRKNFIIFAFLIVGPFAFPFFWFSPLFTKRAKIVTTVILSVSMVALSYACGKLMDRLMQELQSSGLL